MLKKFIISALILSSPYLSFSQYLWDVGGSLGASTFLGELGGKDTPAKKFIGDFNLPTTRAGLGGYVRYKFSPLLSFKAGLAYSMISGADKNAAYLPRKGRNLSFKNDIIELQLNTEVYFYEIPGMVQNFRLSVDFRAYGFAGLSFFHHDPKAELNGKWYKLQPLRTEGIAYSRFGVAIPMGIGAHFTFNRKDRIGFEVCYRKTFTDYLDDVSTTYVDPSTLANPTAVALANRSNELVTTDPELLDLLSYNYLPGGLRGNPKGNDTWITYSVTYSKVIRGKSSFYRSKYPGLFGKKNKKRKIRAKF